MQPKDVSGSANAMQPKWTMQNKDGRCGESKITCEIEKQEDPVMYNLQTPNLKSKWSFRQFLHR